MPGKFSFHDLALGLAIAVPLSLLLLPLVPYPDDHATVMKVWFRAEGARIAHKFSLVMSRGACSEIQYAITDGDPATGSYTRIHC